MKDIEEKIGYLKEHICNKDGDKDYLFISYKSTDKELVLGEIVYKLVYDYGLNVYFDGDFDKHNADWIEQFRSNNYIYRYCLSDKLCNINGSSL